MKNLYMNTSKNSSLKQNETTWLHLLITRWQPTGPWAFSSDRCNPCKESLKWPSQPINYNQLSPYKMCPITSSPILHALPQYWVLLTGYRLQFTVVTMKVFTGTMVSLFLYLVTMVQMQIMIVYGQEQDLAPAPGMHAGLAFSSRVPVLVLGFSLLFYVLCVFIMD